MNTPNAHRSDQESGAATSIQKRSLIQLFFRTSIFEIIATRGRREHAATPGLDALPTTLRELVTRVVRRARLWTHERKDVAAELTSHFREGLAKGTSESDLVREFGNERVAARLIRRGVRRKRPLAWKLWFYWSRSVVAFIGLLVAAYVFLYARAWIDVPSIKRNYTAEWNAAALAIPPQDRAAPLYLAANHAIAYTPGLKDGTRFMVERDPREPGYAVSKAFLEANPRLVEMIKEATRKPRMGMVVGDADPLPHWAMGPFDDAANTNRVVPTASENPALITVLLPHLGPMRQMARFLAQDAAIAVRRGDAARVADDWSDMLGLARHASEDCTLIGQLVGAAVIMMVSDDVVRVMQSHPDLFDEAGLRRVAHELAAASLRDQPGDLALDLRREHDLIEDTLQRVFTDNGHGDGRLAPRGLALLGQQSLAGWMYEANSALGVTDQNVTVGPVAPVAVVLSASRRETSDAYRELAAAYEVDRRVPLWDRDTKSQLAEVGAKYDQGSARTRYFVLGTLWPALGRMISVQRELEFRRDAAMTCVAIAAHRARAGAWPSTLDELVPTHVPRVPIDPFDGKPMRYRLKDGKPLLYSIGADRQDNDGVSPSVERAADDLRRMERSDVVLTKNAIGRDLVFWPAPVFPKPTPPIE